MEKEIFNIYNESADDITKKWYAYMRSHEPKVRAAYGELQSALKSGEHSDIKGAKDVYERTMKNVTLNNDKYKAMLNETTARLSHVNEIALDYINGNLPKVYTLNYNEFANQEISGYAFTLVNEQAVKNLATENKSLLPSKKLDIPKDKKWNIKSINSQVLQGILQGESIPKIANRLQNVVDMNRNSAIRNARTMTTGAENKGRRDSFKKAQDDGVIMSQMWVATHGGRTRDWHADLDGKEVKIGEPWENAYGKIMYPGDPSAHPANVYNCRCAIRAVVKGFTWNRQEQSKYTDIVNHAVDTANSLPIVKKNTDASINKVALSRGISNEEAKNILDKSVSDIVNNSEVGVSITKDNLMTAINEGSFKSVYETGTSKYNKNTKFRSEAEKMMFDISENDIKPSDRPIYGALMPRLNGERSENYYSRGPISKYGDGITIVFNKEFIKDSSTLTLGDSLNYAGRIGVTSLSDPEFTAAYNIGAAARMADGADLIDVADKLDHYFEVQIFGSDTHSINNISRVVISESKIKDTGDLIELLKEKNIEIKKIK